jgi:hypothetical protein
MSVGHPLGGFQNKTPKLGNISGSRRKQSNRQLRTFSEISVILVSNTVKTLVLLIFRRNSRISKLPTVGMLKRSQMSFIRFPTKQTPKFHLPTDIKPTITVRYFLKFVNLPTDKSVTHPKKSLRPSVQSKSRAAYRLFILPTDLS